MRRSPSLLVERLPQSNMDRRTRRRYISHQDALVDSRPAVVPCRKDWVVLAKDDYDEIQQACVEDAVDIAFLKIPINQEMFKERNNEDSVLESWTTSPLD